MKRYSLNIESVKHVENPQGPWVQYVDAKRLIEENELLLDALRWITPIAERYATTSVGKDGVDFAKLLMTNVKGKNV